MNSLSRLAIVADTSDRPVRWRNLARIQSVESAAVIRILGVWVKSIIIKAMV